MTLHLSEASLDWSLRHALQQGDTFLLPRAFEFDAILYDWDDLKGWLLTEDIRKWATRPYRQLLTPKHRYSFRISTQLDPLDFLVFASLIYEVGEDLEASRVPVTEEIVFSYRLRLEDSGALFDESVSYRQFYSATVERLRSGKFGYVLEADIADFYPRIYSHDLTAALNSATTRSNHAAAISEMLKGWAQRVSIGIPVGPAPARVLAEVLLDDVDRLLLAEDLTFVRYNDDYRIFAETEQEAWRALTLLANTLYNSFSLTLQPMKTRISSVEKFDERRLQPGRDREIETLADGFREIAEDLGLDDIYDDIEFDDLDPEVQEEISSLNLGGLLWEQIHGSDELDVPLTRFVLNRLGQVNNADEIGNVIQNIDRLYPAFTAVVQYLRRLRDLNSTRRKEIGKQVLSLLDSSLVAHLEYHRLWLLSMFTDGTEWGNEDSLISLANKLTDDFSMRKLALAIGRSHQPVWFRARRGNVLSQGPWLRRGFLAGASCLPPGQRHHYYQSLEPSLDRLEKAVVHWAREHPF